MPKVRRTRRIEGDTSATITVPGIAKAVRLTLWPSHHPDRSGFYSLAVERFQFGERRFYAIGRGPSPVPGQVESELEFWEAVSLLAEARLEELRPAE